MASDKQFISRVYAYPLVQYATDTAKFYYNSTKENHAYVKAGLETVEQYSLQVLHKAEQYSQQPTIDTLIHKVDDYGCKQLDKFDNGTTHLKKTYYEEIKPKTLESLDSVANKIHGTTIEAGLLKTIGLVDAAVESLFPAPESENKEKEENDEAGSSKGESPNVIEATAPIINKLYDRVNTQSLLQLPARSYNLSKDLLFQAESIPQVNYCVGVLTTSAHKIKLVSDVSALVAKNGLNKGATFTKEGVDYIYISLNNVVGLAGKVVQLIGRLDAVEAKTSVAELITLIQASKEQFAQKVNDHIEHDFESWKKDISTILQKTGDLLATQAALGYDKVQNSNHAAIRASVATIQSIVNNIVERFTPSSSVL